MYTQKRPTYTQNRPVYALFLKEACTYEVHALIPRGLSRANAGKRELYILKRDLCTHERDLCII